MALSLPKRANSVPCQLIQQGNAERGYKGSSGFQRGNRGLSGNEVREVVRDVCAALSSPHHPQYATPGAAGLSAAV